MHSMDDRSKWPHLYDQSLGQREVQSMHKRASLEGLDMSNTWSLYFIYKSEENHWRYLQILIFNEVSLCVMEKYNWEVWDLWVGTTLDQIFLKGLINLISEKNIKFKIVTVNFKVSKLNLAI